MNENGTTEVVEPKHEIRISPEIDRFEAEFSKAPQVDLDLTHRFTPGLYIRRVLIPAGTVCTSKIHKTEHPFVILRGRIHVWNEFEGVKVYVGPHFGITQPGTRRILFAEEDTEWITFHPSKEKDLLKLEEEIIFKHDEHFQFSKPVEALPCNQS